MRKLNLENYQFDVVDEKGEITKGTYEFRGSLCAILFNANLQLNAVDLLDREDIARKIRDCNGKNLLLEEEEYSKIKASLDAFQGFGQNDVPFVKRIVDCSEIKVEEKKS